MQTSNDVRMPLLDSYIQCRNDMKSTIHLYRQLQTLSILEAVSKNSGIAKGSMQAAATRLQDQVQKLQNAFEKHKDFENHDNDGDFNGADKASGLTDAIDKLETDEKKKGMAYCNARREIDGMLKEESFKEIVKEAQSVIKEAKKSQKKDAT